MCRDKSGDWTCTHLNNIKLDVTGLLRVSPRQLLFLSTLPRNAPSPTMAARWVLVSPNARRARPKHSLVGSTGSERIQNEGPATIRTI
jgi:hypothetical protein